MSDQNELYASVETALNTIRPYLQADGGNIELVEITDEMEVLVRLTGACHDCPMSMQTLKSGVEMVVRQAIPSITKVTAIG